MPSFVDNTTSLDYSKDLELDYQALVEGTLTAHVQHCLTDVFQRAEPILFDNQTPLVFFSDCHRGVRERTDLFQENEELFYHALSYYYKFGYTYVEVGDGDEMYKHSFKLIQNSYSRVFELFAHYNYHQRLILISGNHDYGSATKDPEPKDDIPTHEGVILENVQTKQKIFVVHGHQADLLSQCFRPLSRALVRYLLEPLMQLRLITFDHKGEPRLRQSPLPSQILRLIELGQKKIEDRISGWARYQQQMVICGHTHKPRLADNPSVPYFNTGSCIVPGTLTGFEIFDGKIKQVKWSRKAIGSQQIIRELAAMPKELSVYSG